MNERDKRRIVVHDSLSLLKSCATPMSREEKAMRIRPVPVRVRHEYAIDALATIIEASEGMAGGDELVKQLRKLARLVGDGVRVHVRRAPKRRRRERLPANVFDFLTYLMNHAHARRRFLSRGRRGPGIVVDLAAYRAKREQR